MFIRALLGKDDDYQITEVEVDKQLKNIDVWAMINGEYFIVIEDKKGTKEHSDQLERYANYAKERFENLEVKLVYFKMEEQGSYDVISNAKYSLFKREKMLEILGSYFESNSKIDQNCIISDYYKNLKKLDSQINSYKTENITSWNNYAWQGFYSEFQKKIGDGKWGYVANPSGGFMGFWWNWISLTLENKNFRTYLQLEEEKLVFKVLVEESEERNLIRNAFSKILLEKSKKEGLNIIKYGRTGKYMGVAKLVEDYRCTYQDGLLDFDETIENLKKMMSFLEKI